MNSLINLIEAVKNHPKLFKNSLPNDDQDNFQEWSAVAKECKLSSSQAQEKWNLLLLEYVEYLRSNQDFALAKHMDFLQPHFFTVIDTGNIDEEELLSVLDLKKEILKLPKLLEPKKNIESSMDVKIEENVKTNETKKPSIATTDELPKLKEAFPQVVTTSNSVLSHNESSFSNLSSLELIFLGYAKQLQKMPLPVQLKTKRKIADIMDEAELAMINN